MATLAGASAAEHETFTATASVRSGAVSASAPVTVTVTQYSSATDRAAVMAAVREAGTEGLRKALAALPDAGFIQLADRRTPIKYAGQRPTDTGRLLTLVTAEPILFLGAGIPAARSKDGFDVAVAMLEVPEKGAGSGELVPAGKVSLDEGGALLIEDYGSTVMWLNALTRGK
jgi:hypothetical protein